MGMQKTPIKVLYYRLGSNFASRINHVLSSQNIVISTVVDESDGRHSQKLNQSWDIIFTHQRCESRIFSKFLTTLNANLPSVPIILIYNLEYEIQAQHLLNADAQIKAILAEHELENIPSITSKLLQSQQNSYPSFEDKNGEPLFPQLPYSSISSLLNNSSDGIWIIDTEGITSFVNTSLAMMLGYQRDDILGKDLFVFMTEEAAEICKRNLNRREQGIEDKHEFEFIRKDGTPLYASLNTSPIIEDGVYRGTIAIVTDITVLHITEIKYIRINRALKTLRTCMQQVARATNEVDLLNQISRIIVKEGGYKMCWVGYAENDDDKTVSKVAHFGDKYGYLDRINLSWANNKYGRGPTGTAIRTGKRKISREMQSDSRMTPWKNEIEKSHFNSSIALPLISDRQVFGALNIYSNAKNVFDDEEQQLLQELANELAFGIMAIRNREARKQAEVELLRHKNDLEGLVRERTIELERSNRELESFSYSISHDLRAPLRHINGYSNIFRSDYASQIDPEGREILLRIEKAAQNMGSLIDHLLNFSRLNRMQLKLEHLNLTDIANELQQQFSDRISENKVTIEICDNISATCDRQLITLVLQNLLDNALKFVANKQNPFIKFGIDESTHPTVYFVQDNGVGFDMLYVSKIFGTFERLHTDEQYEGSGIGLATVKRIIERHGGKVWAEGKLDEGTTIFFTLTSDIPRKAETHRKSKTLESSN